MPSPQVFGGSWTEKKLKILQGYLKAYGTIFTAKEKARFFNTFYVDAFAGSGYIKIGDQGLSTNLSSLVDLKKSSRKNS
jgi:three-Cys-motif partner protein